MNQTITSTKPKESGSQCALENCQNVAKNFSQKQELTRSSAPTACQHFSNHYSTMYSKQIDKNGILRYPNSLQNNSNLRMQENYYQQEINQDELNINKSADIILKNNNNQMQLVRQINDYTKPDLSQKIFIPQPNQQVRAVFNQAEQEDIFEKEIFGKNINPINENNTNQQFFQSSLPINQLSSQQQQPLIDCQLYKKQQKSENSLQTVEKDVLKVEYEQNLQDSQDIEEIDFEDIFKQLDSFQENELVYLKHTDQNSYFTPIEIQDDSEQDQQKTRLVKNSQQFSGIENKNLLREIKEVISISSDNEPQTLYKVENANSENIPNIKDNSHSQNQTNSIHLANIQANSASKQLNMENQFDSEGFLKQSAEENIVNENADLNKSQADDESSNQSMIQEEEKSTIESEQIDFEKDISNTQSLQQPDLYLGQFKLVADVLQYAPAMPDQKLLHKCLAIQKPQQDFGTTVQAQPTENEAEENFLYIRYIQAQAYSCIFDERTYDYMLQVSVLHLELEADQDEIEKEGKLLKQNKKRTKQQIRKGILKKKIQKSKPIKPNEQKKAQNKLQLYIQNEQLIKLVRDLQGETSPIIFVFSLAQAVQTDSKKVEVNVNVYLRSDCCHPPIKFNVRTNNSEDIRLEKFLGKQSLLSDLLTKQLKLQVIQAQILHRVQSMSAAHYRRISVQSSCNKIQQMSQNLHEQQNQNVCQNAQQLIKSENEELYNIFLNLKDCEINYSEQQQIQHNDNILSLSQSPPVLRTKLQDYQREALTFMQLREGSNLPHIQALRTLFQKQYVHLDSSWQKIETKTGPGQQEQKFIYFCTATGQITDVFPVLDFTCKGGILADDMGLGKTLMTLAHILSDVRPRQQQQQLEQLEQQQQQPTIAEEKAQRCKGGTLIVTKSSLVTHWLQEAKKHIKEIFMGTGNLRQVDEEKINIVAYHGKTKNSYTAEQYASADIVITTYGNVQYDFKLKQSMDSKIEQPQIQDEEEEEEEGEGSNQKQDGGRQAAKEKIQAQKSSHLFSIDWHRIVLDEAHEIRNEGTSTSRACLQLQAQFKWCLTGTPLWNRVDDFYPIFQFLEYAPFNEKNVFRNAVSVHSELGEPAPAFKALQHIFKPIQLRRMKNSRMRDGRAILDTPLPEISHNQIDIEMDQNLRLIYDAVQHRQIQKVNNAAAKGKVPHMMILKAINYMRQLCDHPALVPDAGQQSQHLQKLIAHLDQLILNAESEEKEKFSQKKLDYLKDLRDKVVNETLDECVICYEPLEEVCVTDCAHPHLFCVSCTEVMFTARQEAGHHSFSCPTCRHNITREGIRQFGFEDLQFTKEATQDPSQKVLAVRDKVRQLLSQGDAQTKIIIFTQFLGMMNMLQQQIGRESCVLLHGKFGIQEREKLLDKFKNDPNIKVLICTLKVGGVGLNLVCAQHVMLVEPWWAPAAEMQAINRVHRIGQTRAVQVWRFVTLNSIEENMIKTYHKRKLQIAQHTVDGHANGQHALPKMTVELFRQLL